MDFFRKIGIGIVMIVPTFVGCGALWDIFCGWGAVAAVIIWIIIMGALYGSIISGKLLKTTS